MTPLDEKVVEPLFERAQEASPGVEVSADRFGAAVAAVVAAGTPLGGLHTQDLYLALGCLDRQPAALTALERLVHEVRPSVARACDSADDIDDVLQTTREKLLFGTPGVDPATPKLAQYSGAGPLAAWVRVVAVREALVRARKSRRQKVIDDTVLLDGATTDASLELAMLKQLYGSSFRSAVQDALRRMTAKQRTLLRLHTEERLTIDQLAPMLGIHRASVARRLEAIRREALEHVRAILRERHDLSESETSSLCLALVGEVDVSLGQALLDEAL